MTQTGRLFAIRAVHVRDNGERSTVSVKAHQASVFKSDKRPQTRLVWNDGSRKTCRSLPIKEQRARQYRGGKEIQIYEIQGSNLDSVWEEDVGSAKL